MKIADLALTHELTAYETAYWREVDHNWGRNAHNFYAEEATFELGGKTLVSRKAIEDFYGWRQGRGARTARHVITNFHAEYLSEGDKSQARLECICLLYAADGVPVLPSAPASAILDVTNTYTRAADGGWLINKRVLTGIFRGPEPTTIPPVP